MTFSFQNVNTVFASCLFPYRRYRAERERNSLASVHILKRAASIITLSKMSPKRAFYRTGDAICDEVLGLLEKFANETLAKQDHFRVGVSGESST